MADGTHKPIGDVQLGDLVLATDPVTGTTANRPVTALIAGTGDKHLVRVTVDTDGTHGTATASVVGTDHHPFWVPALNQWVNATDLQVGQWLQTSTGAWAQITAIDRWTQNTHVNNLTIGDIHTYYVLAGSKPVLVHNANCRSVSGWTRHGAEQAEARGISEDMAKNTVRTGRPTPGNRQGTTKYTGQKVWVVLNNECRVVSCGWNGRR